MRRVESIELARCIEEKNVIFDWCPERERLICASFLQVVHVQLSHWAHIASLSKANVHVIMKRKNMETAKNSPFSWMPRMRRFCVSLSFPPHSPRDKEHSCAHTKEFSTTSPKTAFYIPWSRTKMNIINPMALDYTLINRFIDTSCAHFHNKFLMLLTKKSD